MRKIVAIDARELTKNNLGSLGMALLSVIGYLRDYELLLLSDIEVPLHYMPDNARNIARGAAYTGGFDLVKYEWWMSRILKKENVGILYQINHFSVIRMKNVKQITVIHDLYPLEGIEARPLKIRIAYRIFLALSLINSYKIFTVSNFTKERVQAKFWSSPKISVNYNGVSGAEELDESFSLQIDCPYIFLLGRVSYWKGTMRVVSLFDRYFSQSGYKLVLAGQADREEDALELEEYARRNSGIIWMHYVNNQVREWLMRNCSLLIYASRYDGFGLPPLEAAKRRRKILMNDIPVLREVTMNKGRYVDFFGDDKLVCDAITQALESEDPRRIEEMYEVARSYTWKSNADRIIEVIEGTT